MPNYTTCRSFCTASQTQSHCCSCLVVPNPSTWLPIPFSNLTSASRSAVMLFSLVHTVRETQTQVNGTCCCEWMQGTSKELSTNLRARVNWVSHRQAISQCPKAAAQTWPLLHSRGLRIDQNKTDNKGHPDITRVHGSVSLSSAA